MSDLILEKKWTRWYPKNIFLKDLKINKKTLYYSDKLIEEDFILNVDDINHKKECDINQKNYISKIDLTKTKSYELGFKKGFLEGTKENVLFENKLHNLFLDFENSLSVFENELYSRLLTIVLKISSYVIGKQVDIDQSILLNYVKKIIDKDGIFLKKPQLIIHPNNKIIIEKKFKEFLNIYKWTLVYDDSIDLNSCKVKSESGYMDATVNARWQELCRLIDSEEH